MCSVKENINNLKFIYQDFLSPYQNLKFFRIKKTIKCFQYFTFNDMNIIKIFISFFKHHM